MLREGTGEPLVLLHGIFCSERVWHRVVPFLAHKHDVIALTALGHRGGNAAQPGTQISDVVDDAEATLDHLKLHRPHIAGNSMGGWVAIELARRGRARSVCALSPAGFWNSSSKNQHHAANALKSVVRLARLTRWALPVLSLFNIVRRFAMKDNLVHGDMLTAAQIVDMADDLLECSVRNDLLDTTQKLRPLNPVPCPIMLAWSQYDRIFPLEVNGEYARMLIPEAQWRVLPGVGHLSMLDNPKLVADTILESVGHAS